MHTFPSHLLRSSVLSAAFFLCCSAPLPAQPASTADADSHAESITDALRISPVMADIIRRLGDPDYATRVAASNDLRVHPDTTLALLENILSTYPLNPEQRRRVDAVAYRRFADSPRAGLGISWGGDPGARLRYHIVIAVAYEPFPAAKLLQPGDVLTEINHIPLEYPSSAALLRSQILARTPGESINLTFYRGAEKINLDVPLGSFATLQNAATPTDDVLRDAWKIRCAEKLGEPSPLHTDLAPEDWVDEDSFIDRAIPARRPGDAGLPRPLLVAAAGDPRGGAIADGELYYAAQRFGKENLAINPRAAIPARADLLRSIPASVLSKIEQLADEKQQLDIAIQNSLERLAALETPGNPDLIPDPDGLRAAVNKNLELYRKLAAALDAETADFLDKHPELPLDAAHPPRLSPPG